jgi:glycosyltransferase involved in cell wall biosynthesis
MTDTSLVSIVMNCYNGERYLRYALDSVIEQTYQNWELIFWDNQSTDKSEEIFKSYHDQRFKYYFAPKHTLLYEARNCAIKRSSGVFYAFLDVDDWWDKEKLAKQLPLFLDSDVGLVCSNFWVVNEKYGISKKYWKFRKPTGWILDELLKDYFVGLLTIIVRRTVFESLIYGFDSRYNIIGDFDFTIRVSEKWMIDGVQEPLAHYRLHGENESILHNDLQVIELDNWHAEKSENPVFAKMDGFKRSIFHLEYMKAVVYVDQNKYIDAIKVLYSLPICTEKFKLLFIIIAPHLLVKLLRT